MLLNLESGAYAFTADPDEGTLTIGRENDCNFVVKEDGVSRHHCKLWFENGDWLVEDTESRWGTQVNNKQVQKPAKLKNGDVLRLSNVTFMVSLHRTNDPKDIGRQLAGGAREKLKILDDNNKAAAKATRIMRNPAKDSNKKIKAAPKDEEAEAPLEESEPPAEDTSAEAPSTEEAAADSSDDAPKDEAPAEEAEEEKPKTDKPDKKGSKIRIPAKGGSAKGLASKTAGAKSARPTRAPKEKDAPKNGGGMLKIIIAVVVLAGLGAGAYFGGLIPGSGDAKTETKKEDPKTESAGPVIPPKKEEPKEEEKKEEPSAEKTADSTQ